MAEGFTPSRAAGDAVTDAVIGAIWVAGPTLEDWRLAMIDSTGPGFSDEDIEGIGRAPRRRHAPVQSPPPVDPPRRAASLAGHPLDHVRHDDRPGRRGPYRPAGRGSTRCRGPSSSTRTVPPFAKGDFLREVVPPQIGLSDATDGIVYDRFHPGTAWVYLARAISDEIGGGSNILRRVHLLTGQIQEVVRSNTLYDWTSNPPSSRRSTDYPSVLSFRDGPGGEQPRRERPSDRAAVRRPVAAHSRRRKYQCTREFAGPSG